MNRKKGAGGVADKILEYIAEHDMEPGNKLPPIGEISDNFGISQGKLREGLMQLSALGIVDIKQGKGTFVAEQNISTLLKKLSYQPWFKEVDFIEVLQARNSIISMAAKLIISNHNQNIANKLNEINNYIEKAINEENDETFSRLNWKFHQTTAEKSGNKVLSGFMVIIKDMLGFLYEKHISKEFMRSEFKFNKNLIESIENGSYSDIEKYIINNDFIDISEKTEYTMEIYSDALGTGSIGGSFYTIGNYIARTVSEKSRIKPIVYSTGGGIENVRLTNKKDIFLSISQASTAIKAFYGEGEFEESFSSLRLICCLPDIKLQVFTLDSKIDSIKELKDKNIAIGAEGGASSGVAKKILKYYSMAPGEDYQSKKLPFSSAIELMNKGKIDATFFLSIGPSPALMELISKNRIHLLEIADNVINKFTNDNPLWNRDFLKPFTYPNQENKIKTIGAPAVLITHEELDENLAYKITSIIMRNIEALSSLTFSDLSINKAISNPGLMYHPGAQERITEILDKT